ncbi:unnamed protein product [Ilex paraguariensis]|uniref:COBRA-like protein n=1 Tax=Ilex paraguariensis TaxID=185542 RepID=A0ABC8STP5_9AQUA
MGRAVVTMYNFQQYRHIQAPGWSLGWTWAEKELIWNMIGSQTTEQGDCSRFKGNIPHCCKKDPTVVDLLPGTPYNQQDPANAASSFQLSVGAAGTTNKTVRVPRNFTLKTPGPGYTCGPTKVTITNFNYRMNYTQWNLVVQHPNFDNLSQFFGINYKPLTPYASINDTAMLWGIKFYNDVLMQAGTLGLGNVQLELLFRKDKSTFTFEKGWAFPRRIYFNGDNCGMPPPDAYPYLPKTSSR